MFGRMSKANTLWAISIALLAVSAALELGFHNSPARVESTSPAKSLVVPVASNGFVRPSKGKSPIGESVEPSSAAPTNTNGKPLTATLMADAEQPVFDREFAAAAAKPYVEAYQRQHPMLKVGTFAWDQFQIVFVSEPDSSNTTGYLGVFFPTSGSSGAGFTCFKVQGDADHLEPLIWGYAPNLARAIEDLRRGAAESKGCFFPLL